VASYSEQQQVVENEGKRIEIFLYVIEVKQKTLANG
jgi:hypothetical protein